MNTSTTLSSPQTGGLRRAPPTRDPAPGACQAWTQGVALAKAGRNAEALPHFERATRLAPGAALYWMNRASIERRLKRFDGALLSARKAFDLDRSSALGCHLLTELLRLNLRDDEALQVLQQLDPQTPRDTQHWRLEGALHMAARSWEPAAMAWLQVLSECPADAEAYMQLGFALANLKRFSEGAECFRTVSILDPAALGAASYALHYACWACDWTSRDDDSARVGEALAIAERQGEAPTFSPFSMLAVSDDPELLRRMAALQAGRIAREARALAGWRPPKSGPAGYPQAAAALRSGRIRVGFISADFRLHATSILLVQTLERLDRTRFELVLYSHGADDGSALGRRIRGAADRLVDTRTMIPEQMAQRIREDGIALLVDLCGYTGGSRLGTFALRPAPVQASWLAYPGSTGADFIDYIVGDPVVTPMAHAAQYTEQIAQLPVCYQPTDEDRAHPEPLGSRDECGLPEQAFVFASFNQSYKITEPVFDAWCRILARTPGSVLWLLVPELEAQDRLRTQAQARGVAAERLVFAPFVDQAAHLARLPQADLFLDTFPCGAHTTCSDALWMGLPVLTVRGSSFASRVAASLLHAVDLPGLVADDLASYESQAVTLAADGRARLEACREHLWHNRRDLALFDNARLSRDLGELFGRMVQRWLDGQPPAPLPAAGKAIC